MGSSQQFSFKWVNHFEHIICAFDTLRIHEHLVDVTLSCEGKKIRAHKMILSACSTYFIKLFKEIPCKHPVIIFDNVKFIDLAALIKFMYQGEVNVSPEQLRSFFSTAEFLAVEGLTQREKDNIPVNDDLEIPKPEVQLQNIIDKSTEDNKRNKSSLMPYHADESQPEVPPNKRRKIRESTNANAQKNSAGINAKDWDGKTSENQTGSDLVEIMPLMPNLKLPEYLEQDGNSCSYEDQSIDNNKTIMDDTSLLYPECKLDISETFFTNPSTSVNRKHQSDIGHLFEESTEQKETQNATQKHKLNNISESSNSSCDNDNDDDMSSTITLSSSSSSKIDAKSLQSSTCIDTSVVESAAVEKHNNEDLESITVTCNKSSSETLKLPDDLSNDNFKQHILQFQTTKLKQIANNITILTKRRNFEEDESNKTFTFENYNFPFKEVQHMDALEDFLVEDHNFTNFVKQLEKIEKTSYKCMVKYIMTSLMSNDLAMAYNWPGYKGKQSFSNLRICSAVLIAVQEKHYCTKAMVQTAIKSWLIKSDKQLNRRQSQRRKKTLIRLNL